MDQGAVETGGPVAWPDRLSPGALLAAVPRSMVDEATEVCGVDERPPGGRLPPHVTAYLTMALCLFPDDGAEEVARKVIGALSEFGDRDTAWEPATSSAIAHARERLGRDLLRETFYRVAGRPVATAGTRGAWLRQWRLMALDAFGLDVPDSPQNGAEFGYPNNGRARSARPRARVVTVVECGSHAFVDAEVGPWTRSRTKMATSLLISISDDWLLLADRGLYSFATFSAATRTGAALCWRAPARLSLPILEVLSDGSYLSALVDPAIRGREREELLDEARSGSKPDPAAAHVVRVVEYDVPDHEGPEQIRLITNITDPGRLTAAELAGAYRRRLEDATTGRGPGSLPQEAGTVLRSTVPDLVHQEIWAYLLVHHAINSLICQATTRTDAGPDRVSLPRAVDIVGRTATGTAAPSP
ncbi:IS4 family transposase [Kitasatospora sp. NPDC057015]|uniref:IS4 family transposase n=1 Tax=Kitasatospora sp. NPDC057015 TaxID=3346001 RepID=UPI003645E64B